MYSYQRRNLTVPRLFSQTVSHFGRRKCLVHMDKSWTFLDLEEYSNKVANFFLAEGYKPGDCIALQMHNRPVRQTREKGRCRKAVLTGFFSSSLLRNTSGSGWAVPKSASFPR